MIRDLTIIFLTANEMPDSWVRFHRRILEAAIQGTPVITVSRKPVNFGTNLIDTEKKDYTNIYRQLLRAAKTAETQYIAVAEDDTLYCADHFTCFRPDIDVFGYNFNRWGLFSWDKKFSYRNRISNCALIASRELLVTALQERFDAWPDGNFPMEYMGECGRNGCEAGLRITKRKSVKFYSKTPIVQLSHPNGTEERQKRSRKKHGDNICDELLFWGFGKDIIRHYE